MMIITTDIASMDRSASSCHEYVSMATIITITITAFIYSIWNKGVLALCINTRNGSRHQWSSLGRSSSFCLSLSCFAFSGSNLVVLIIKASVSCCCRVNQEVKRAPKNSIFTQVDQHNEEHAVDRDRLLSCQIKWRRVWLLETDNKQPCWYVFCCGHASEHARWGTLWNVWIGFGLTYTSLSLELSSLHTNTLTCQIGFYQRVNVERLHFVCFELIPFGAPGWTDAVYPYSPPLHSPSKLADPLTAYNLSHQSLFLRSRCFPMSAGPLTKQDGEPSSFKVLHMSLPSLLSFPLLTPTFVIPWDTVPRPILMVGKHILIDACVLNPNEKVGWRDTREQKAVSYCIFAVGLMTHLSWNMDWNPSGSPVKDTNGRWLIGNWGKWLLWYWYYHWCNVIEMAMKHNHIPFSYIILREGEQEVQNMAEIMILFILSRYIAGIDIFYYCVLLRMDSFKSASILL